MDLKLAGKVALLTGATNGIGEAVCRTLAEEGARLAFTDINVGKGEALAKDLEASGSEALFLKMDVRNYDEVKACVAKVKAHFGRIDILAYLAGVGSPKRFADTDPATWKATVDVLLYGMMNTVHAILPVMTENRYGRIVSVIGESSRVGESGLSLIAASRAGQPALFRSLAREVGRFNITLNCVAIGIVETSHYPSGHLDKYREKIVQNYPLGRLGVAEDVAPMVAFLCSDLSRWMTGQVVGVNGGYAMV
jgi:2-hydroxycyclohexanecarboxyl-CoA dehydrogenase